MSHESILNSYHNNTNRLKIGKQMSETFQNRQRIIEYLHRRALQTIFLHRRSFGAPHRRRRESGRDTPWAPLNSNISVNM